MGVCIHTYTSIYPSIFLFIYLYKRTHKHAYIYIYTCIYSSPLSLNYLFCCMSSTCSSLHPLPNTLTRFQLSGVIKYVVEEGRTLIGRAQGGGDPGKSHPDIRQRLLLNGLSLQSEHAILSRTGDTVSLQPLGSAQVCCAWITLADFGARGAGLSFLKHFSYIFFFFSMCFCHTPLSGVSQWKKASRRRRFAS